MDNLKLNGYYLEVSRSEYNSSGKVNGSWRSNLPFYIDINKNVVISSNGKYLSDSINSASSVDNQDYRPIGERVGDVEKKFNSIVFSGFSMGKGSYQGKDSKKYSSDSIGILLSGGIVISLDGDNETNEIFKESSQLFFNDMLEIKKKLNQVNSISIGEINGDLSGKDIFGLERSALETLQQDPVSFLSNHCQDSNQSYQSFKKYIIQMNSLFNVLSWQIQNIFNSKPAIILLIAKAYNEINTQRIQNNQTPFEYYLTLTSDFTGLESRISLFWFKNCDSVFKQDEYQKPSSIIFMAMGFDTKSYEKANKKTLLQDIVLCPFSKPSHEKESSSLKLCKSLYNVDSIDLVKSKSIITLGINRKEPILYHQQPKNSNLFDESFIEKLSKEALSNNLKGVLLYQDRCEYAGYYIDSPESNLPPSKSSYDASISNYYSEDNTIKINNYLNQFKN